jgi:hypothetical protein
LKRPPKKQFYLEALPMAHTKIVSGSGKMGSGKMGVKDGKGGKAFGGKKAGGKK